MQRASKNIIKKYTNWGDVFASAKPMEFNAFNSQDQPEKRSL